MHLTNNLRVIQHAWHFWYAASFGGESGLRKVGLGGTHPLTRRYIFGEAVCLKEQIFSRN
ncbi:DUF3265 domain-containing protein [Vibrio parahaemolyticus]